MPDVVSLSSRFLIVRVRAPDTFHSRALAVRVSVCRCLVSATCWRKFSRFSVISAWSPNPSHASLIGRYSTISMFALVLLQNEHNACRLSRLFEPPRLRGTIWSISIVSESENPHARHRQLSRFSTACRVSVFVIVSPLLFVFVMWSVYHNHRPDYKLAFNNSGMIPKIVKSIASATITKAIMFPIRFSIVLFPLLWLFNVSI